MQAKNAELAHFPEGFEIEGFVQIVFLNPGYDFVTGEPDYFFLEHQLFLGKREIHETS
jgi:hypothetical protein